MSDRPIQKTLDTNNIFKLFESRENAFVNQHNNDILYTDFISKDIRRANLVELKLVLPISPELNSPIAISIDHFLKSLLNFNFNS